MIPTTDTCQNCYKLLQNVLMDAFQTETFFFTPPYQDLDKIDRGIRNIVWPDYYNTDNRLVPSINSPDKRFFVVKSNLGFYNIMIYLTAAQQPDFISIGPFRSEGFSNTFFTQLMKESKVPDGAYNTLSQFYKAIRSQKNITSSVTVSNY